jgi:hypothetical protein
MKVIVDAAIIDEKDGETGREPIEFECIGSQGWVRMTIGSQTWDIDYREFWNAARAIGVETSPL